METSRFAALARSAATAQGVVAAVLITGDISGTWRDELEQLDLQIVDSSYDRTAGHGAGAFAGICCGPIAGKKDGMPTEEVLRNFSKLLVAHGILLLDIPAITNPGNVRGLLDRGGFYLIHEPTAPGFRAISAQRREACCEAEGRVLYDRIAVFE